MRRPFFPVLIRVLAWLAFACAVPCLAEEGDPLDHIISREVFRDETGQMPLSEVINAHFTPSKGIFAGGYTKDVVWLKFAVRPATDGAPLILRILPAYLNEITLFAPDPEQPGTWRNIATGNAIPWQARPHASISLGLPVHPAATTPYYLRLQTASNALLQFQALTTGDAAHEEVTAMLWQGLYMAIILWMVLWAFHDYWLSRDRVILIFAFTYSIYLAYVLAILGYLAPVFPNSQSMPILTFWIVTLATFASISFHRTLLLLFGVVPFARWGLNALLGTSGLAIGLLLAGETAAALKLNSLVALICAPSLFLSALTARHDALPGRFRLKVYYGFICISILGYIPSILGLATANAWSLYGALVQGLVTAVLFGNLLHARSRQLVDQQAQASLRLRLSEHEIALQKAQLAEQGQFTAMLTHGLKNPLATIRFSVDGMQQQENSAQDDKRQQRIGRAIDEIDALIERCILSDRIERSNTEIRTAPVDVGQLVREWQAQHPNGERLHLASAATLPAVSSDPQLLAVTIANLLDNALKYSPPDSAVNVVLHPETDEHGATGLCLEVANQPGLAGFPDAEHAFDKYHRGQAASRENGTGLGLYIVKGIAERLGGRVGYLPQPNRIVFRLWIPQTPR